MATVPARRFQPETTFMIREDTPTHDAGVAMDEDAETEGRTDADQDEGESDNESSFSESSSSEDALSDHVTEDMVKLQEGIPGFKEKYRLIKRIGEGVSNRTGAS
jgi:cell division control protein 7